MADRGRWRERSPDRHESFGRGGDRRGRRSGSREPYGYADDRRPAYPDARRRASDERRPELEEGPSSYGRRSPERPAREMRERRGHDAGLEDGRHESSSRQTAEAKSQPKEKPNYGLSGALAAETNTYKGVVLKYNEPPEARKPTRGWRMFVFKNGKEIDMLRLQGQSAFLFGRDRLVVDVPLDHGSCSKQHAVVQFREVSSTNEWGDRVRSVKPYIIDLDSSNGTKVNGKALPPSRYVELLPEDMVQFGSSSREYVAMAE